MPQIIARAARPTPFYPGCPSGASTTKGYFGSRFIVFCDLQCIDNGVSRHEVIALKFGSDFSNGSTHHGVVLMRFWINY